LSSAEVLLTVISTVVGALIGLATSHYYFRRGLSAGPQMVISLTEQARIEPATVGVKVEMKVGPIEVTNLVVLEVAVSNPGDKNLDVKDADDEQRRPKRPRIELPTGLRAVADPWKPGRRPDHGGRASGPAATQGRRAPGAVRARARAGRRDDRAVDRAVHLLEGSRAADRPHRRRAAILPRPGQPVSPPGATACSRTRRYSRTDGGTKALHNVPTHPAECPGLADGRATESGHRRQADSP